MSGKRQLSRSERASKYAEQHPEVRRNLGCGTILRDELERHLANAYMAGWNEKTKLGRKKEKK